MTREPHQDYRGVAAAPNGRVAPRLLPEEPLPRYAYVPGRGLPHPIRNAAGHSFGVAELDLPPERAFARGLDLFNHGYYWEAHEAWEAPWRAAQRDSVERTILKALILLAASSVKLREGKPASAGRHLRRAADTLSVATGAVREPRFKAWLADLGALLQSLALETAALRPSPEDHLIVFSFVLDAPVDLLFGTEPEPET